MFPTGEIVEYRDDNKWRTTNEEKRTLERLSSIDYNDVRRAAEVHRQVRKIMQSKLRPGMELLPWCEELEGYTRLLVEENGLEAGIAFPTGVSLNNCAAHYTPNPGDRTVLQYGDVCKVDFGINVKGMECVTLMA